MLEEAQTLIKKIKVALQEEKSDVEIFQTILDLFGRDRETDEHVAALLADLPHTKVARVLHRMLEVSKEKKVRKIIKRSLYRLKNKGITVEEVLLEKKEPILRLVHTEPSKGIGSGPDFIGRRFLMLAVPHTGRGWTVMHGVISDTRGITNFSGEVMTRKGFQRFIEEIRTKSPFPLVDMEPSYVGFLFSQAYQLTLERKEVPPGHYPHFKNEIDSIKKTYKRPLIYSLLQADEIAGDDRILQRGVELLKDVVISTWRIEEDNIRPYAEEVWEAGESKIVLTKTQGEARFQGIYQKALSELFTDERRSLYKRRLEEMAYIFFKLGKKEEAKISLSVAIEIKQPVNPIQPNPFLLHLVIMSISIFLKEAYEQKVKEPSLIVKP